MKRKNDWNVRFGAKRRASDRALLAECERQIGLEETVARLAEIDQERVRIAQAFGRPLDSGLH